ncbi:DUF2891 domain-containing protein [Sphingosinicella sp. BN140058]|uniref:DUF2891 domain-containing protein n=1 Tax=Sphingosinicella sp. BN140058 TaxID=1892855 RepID=UPI0010121501|nr:DUF2891 domain-containing protein [Sphingosinicella sp. BN140058]QAY78356.1 DUF2891 domain-containing protein [Sphingosinicella sp. BN140058]
MTQSLTPEIAARFAGIALGHVTREYPHKLDHVMDGPEDVLSPGQLHPIFHGSFDWHSCVHGWWLMLRLRRLFPDMAEARRIERLADELLTPANIAGELAYLDRAYSGGFERPYGWAWLLALHREAQRHEDQPWGADLAPLAAAFADRFHLFLPKLTYPLRVGTHFNTAFALTLALEWAEANDRGLADLVRRRARDWFGEDRCYHGWEPGGDEFLSGGLSEALLMRTVLGDAGFADWFDAFLPEAAVGIPRSLFTPAIVSDRSDGKIAHLDGLNLSRAWCWRGIADALDPALAELVRRTADEHLDASLPHVAGDYMGEHWLATFALLALER